MWDSSPRTDITVMILKEYSAHYTRNGRIHLVHTLRPEGMTRYLQIHCLNNIQYFDLDFTNAHKHTYIHIYIYMNWFKHDIAANRSQVVIWTKEDPIQIYTYICSTWEIHYVLRCSDSRPECRTPWFCGIPEKRRPVYTDKRLAEL